VASRGSPLKKRIPPPIPLKGCNSMQKYSATRRQVSKSSRMLRGHSIKVLMTRRSIALNSSHKDYDHITTSPGGMALVGTENGVAVRPVDHSTIWTEWYGYVCRRRTIPSLAAWRCWPRFAACLIKSQRLGDSSITRVGVAVHIGKSLSIGVHDLEAAV
jgi:hypothetical protein